MYLPTVHTQVQNWLTIFIHTNEILGKRTRKKGIWFLNNLIFYWNETGNNDNNWDSTNACFSWFSLTYWTNVCILWFIVRVFTVQCRTNRLGVQLLSYRALYSTGTSLVEFACWLDWFWIKRSRVIKYTFREKPHVGCLTISHNSISSRKTCCVRTLVFLCVRDFYAKFPN